MVSTMQLLASGSCSLHVQEHLADAVGGQVARKRRGLKVASVALDATRNANCVAVVISRSGRYVNEVVETHQQHNGRSEEVNLCC